MRSIITTAALGLALFLGSACGGDGYGGDTPPATQSQSDALNGCSTYTDHTSASDAREIAWGFEVTSDPAHCMTVKVGQTVHWNGNLGSHPLGVKGGDSPSPIATVDPTGHVTFTAAGTYGYTCTVHSPMIGAIKVVE